jgi:hypothetical protein
MIPLKKSYTAGHFELAIDGHKSTAYLRSIDGGYVRTSIIDEPIGPENARIKHTSTVDIEPFTIDFGLSGANDVLKWIQESWRKDPTRRNGQITHADFDLFKTFEHEFFDALITETTFPTLDGASRDPAYIKIKLQPERVISRKVQSMQRVSGTVSSKQKLWMCSGFRLSIDGLDEMQYTNKIESFTIKQGTRAFHTGAHRFPQIEPTKIDFPNLSGTIGLVYADQILRWYDSYVVKGQRDSKAQKTGSLEFLSPDRRQSLFRINLYDIGLQQLHIEQSTAATDQIKRVKFDLYVGRMEIDGSNQLGMS